MVAKILYGTEVANKIKEELITKTEELKKDNIFPHLVVISTSYDKSSQVYVKSLEKKCNSIGIKFTEINIDEYDTTSAVELIKKTSHRDDVHGILIQSPLPKQFDSFMLKNAISPEKDVDGCTAENQGRIAYNKAFNQPCTPAGIVEILKYYEIPTEGKNVVIVNRTPVIGKPLSFMLLNLNATVTICHSKTVNLPSICKNADILITAIGKANFIGKDYIKPNSVVIDAGINCDENGKIVGDVVFDEAMELCEAVTPVPKGVGTVTSIMAMKNLIENIKK